MNDTEYRTQLAKLQTRLVNAQAIVALFEHGYPDLDLAVAADLPIIEAADQAHDMVAALTEQVRQLELERPRH